MALAREILSLDPLALRLRAILARVLRACGGILLTLWSPRNRLRSLYRLLRSAARCALVSLGRFTGGGLPYTDFCEQFPYGTAAKFGPLA